MFNTARRMEMRVVRKGSGASLPSIMSIEVTACICHSVSSPWTIASTDSAVVVDDDDAFDGKTAALDPLAIVEGVLTVRLLVTTEEVIALVSLLRLLLAVSIPSIARALAWLYGATTDIARRSKEQTTRGEIAEGNDAREK